MGLASLTHTPSPMGFLGRLLGRPENEKPFLRMPVGYPHEEATVPNLRRKPLDRARRNREAAERIRARAASTAKPDSEGKGEA